MEEMREGASFPRSTMEVGEGKISCLEEQVYLGKKGAFYRSHKKRAVAGKITPETPVRETGDSGPPRDSGVSPDLLRTPIQRVASAGTKNETRGPQTPV